MAEDEEVPCLYSGFVVDSDKAGSFYQQQKHYLHKLEHLPSDASFSAFRSMRMKLAWLAHTRPDCLFEISQLAQVTEDRFKENKVTIIKRLNRVVDFSLRNHFALKIPKLDRK